MITTTTPPPPPLVHTVNSALHTNEHATDARALSLDDEIENSLEPICEQALQHIHANDTVLTYGRCDDGA